MTLTRTEKRNLLRAHYQKLGRLGSAARAKVLTPAERKAIARLGGQARKKKLDAAKVLDK